MHPHAVYVYFLGLRWTPALVHQSRRLQPFLGGALEHFVQWILARGRIAVIRCVTHR
jgi:hypothetical protein